jgi:hypothetical protein
MSEPIKHLSGAVFEAIAAGEAATTDAAEHLKTCAHCRAELNAMTNENALFAAELGPARSEESAMTSAANTAKVVSQSHKPLAFYAVAASIMLVSALALIYFSKQTRDTRNAAVKLPTPAPGPQQQTPAEENKDEKSEKPEHPKPKEGEAVYEGKTAAEWLQKMNQSAANGSSPEAYHALLELGIEALPQIIELSRMEDKARYGQELLIGIRVEKGDLPRLKELLTSTDFATRRAGISLLARLCNEKAPELSDAVRNAITPALSDRDKAVVEAANKALDSLNSLRKQLDMDLAMVANTKQREIEDLEKRARLKTEIDLLTKQIGLAGNAVTEEQRLEWRKKREQDIEALNQLQNRPARASIGKVLAVKDHLIMISIGSQMGAVAGTEYVIYRGADYVTRVRIEKVYPDMSSGHTVAEPDKGPALRGICVNDDVYTDPKEVDRRTAEREKLNAKPPQPVKQEPNKGKGVVGEQSIDD